MSKLGHPVTYTVPDLHVVETPLEPVGDAEAETLTGSVHHPEMTAFAGLVGRIRDDGTCDLMIFVPNKEARWVDAVPEGTGPGTFWLLRHEPEELDDAGGSPIAEAKTAAAAAVNAASSASSSASSASSSAGSASASATSAAASAANAAASAKAATAAADGAKAAPEVAG